MPLHEIPTTEAMEQIQAQLNLIGDEITMLKGELVTVKAAHANLHQAAVDAGTTAQARHMEQTQKMTSMESQMDSLADQIRSGPGSDPSKRRSLIEPKQVTVEEFAGAITDSRSQFLSWSERVKDRVGLYDEA